MDPFKRLGEDPYEIILSKLSLKDIEALLLSNGSNNTAIAKTFQSNRYWCEKLKEFDLNPVFNAQGLYHIALVVPRAELLLVCMKMESILFIDNVINSYNVTVMDILETAVKSHSIFIFNHYIELKNKLNSGELSQFLTFSFVPVTNLLLRDEMLESFSGKDSGEEYKKELGKFLSPAVIKRIQIPIKTLKDYHITNSALFLLDLILYRPKLLNKHPSLLKEIVYYYLRTNLDKVNLLVNTINQSTYDYDAILLVIAVVDCNVHLFKERLPRFKELSKIWQKIIIKEICENIQDNNGISKVFFDTLGVNWRHVFVTLIAFSDNDDYINLVFDNYAIDSSLLKRCFRDCTRCFNLSLDILVALAKTKAFKELNKRLLYNCIKNGINEEERQIDVNDLLLDNGIEYLMP